MFDDQTRAASRRSTSTSSATRSPAAARTSTCAIEALNPLLRDLVPVMRNLSDPRTQLAQLFRALGARGARCRAGRRDAGRRCSATSTRRSRALANVARPYIQQSIVGGPPALDAATAAFPRSGRSWPTASALFRELRPGVARAAHRGARPRRRVRDRHAGRCARSVALNAAPRADVRRAAALRRGPARRARRRRPDEHAQSSTRRSRTSTPVADGLQLRDALVPQRREPAQRGRRERHLAALHRRRRAAGPEQRGRPVVGAGRRPDAATTSCTPTRTRTPPSPGQPEECEAGNEDYAGGPARSIGNVPGQPGHAPRRARRGTRTK